jgi:MscS family membrane protein
MTELLVRRVPGGLLLWQVVAIPLFCVAAWAIGRLLGAITHRIFLRIAKGTRWEWDNILVERWTAPLSFAWTLLLLRLSLAFVDLGAAAEAWIVHALNTLLFATFLWALVRTVDVVATAMVRSPWALAHPGSRSLVPLGGRVVKVVVAALAVVAFISQLGYPVTSLIAGLGIGGLALALAAQKTVENLFGAFSIGLDQPFEEGDFVRIDDVVGTVEAIGLRSTRVRTLDRTLVTIPNGRLSDTRVENYAVRDRMRLATTVQLVYSSTPAQVREVLAGLERVLREHPKIWPDAVVVRFKELAASSLDIEVMAWFLTRDYGEFQAIRQDILLSWLDVVERAGTSFAFPTRTVHVVQAPAA